LLRTEAVDASLLKDPSLIIYEAMLELPGIYLVSNGDQTRTLYETLRQGGTFDAALATRDREPDAPNYTPRISGMLDMRTQPATVMLSLLKANPINPEFTDRFTYRPAMPAPGFGVWIDNLQWRWNAAAKFCRRSVAAPLSRKGGGCHRDVLERAGCQQSRVACRQMDSGAGRV